MKRFISGNTYYHYAHPPEELDENFAQMMAMGINAVRTAEVWPGWSTIEKTEGEYDFDLLDDYVNKAGKHGLKVCVGVGIVDTPFWVYRKWPDLRFRDTDGRVSKRRIQSACFDHAEYRALMNRFIVALTKHYAGRKEVFSFQFGNELRYNLSGDGVCDCPATRLRFRGWIRRRFNDDLQMLNREWGTEYSTFDEIFPYMSNNGPPTEGITGLALASRRFQNWSIEELISSGIALMKEHTDLPIFHNNFGALGMQGNQWRITESNDVAVMDIYATTYSRPGVYNGFLLDTARSIATQQSKELWIGETSAGQYGTFIRNEVEQKMVENCCIEQLGAGATAIFYFRHKPPVWEQPHKFTGSQSIVRIDNSETAYTQTPRTIDALVQRYGAEILTAEVPRPEVAVYYPNESLLLGKAAAYYEEEFQSAFGGRAIWAASGFPVEIIEDDYILNSGTLPYKLIYMPHCVLLDPKIGKRLAQWCAAGGILVSEGRPAYVDNEGRLYKIQPGAGLDEVFGCREDIYSTVTEERFSFNLDAWRGELSLPGTRQSYRLEAGRAFGYDAAGKPAAVENRYEKGYTYLLGCNPSLLFGPGGGKYDSGTVSESGCGTAHRKHAKGLIATIARRHGITPPVNLVYDNPDLTIRYLRRRDAWLLFCINYGDAPAQSELPSGRVEELTPDGEQPSKNSLSVPAKDWKILRFREENK